MSDLFLGSVGSFLFKKNPKHSCSQRWENNCPYDKVYWNWCCLALEFIRPSPLVLLSEPGLLNCFLLWSLLCSTSTTRLADLTTNCSILFSSRVRSQRFLEIFSLVAFSTDFFSSLKFKTIFFGVSEFPDISWWSKMQYTNHCNIVLRKLLVEYHLK